MKKYSCKLTHHNSSSKLTLIVSGIKPKAESFTVRVFVGLEIADYTTPITNNLNYVSNIYMYSFGEGMDKEGRIVEGLGATQQHLVVAPAFNAILDLNTLDSLYAKLPLQLDFIFVPVSSSDGLALPEELIEFDSLTISSH